MFSINNNKKRISPFDDHAGIFADHIVLGEYEQGARVLARHANQVDEPMKCLADAWTVRQVLFGVACVGGAILVQMRRPGYRYCHVEFI